MIKPMQQVAGLAILTIVGLLLAGCEPDNVANLPAPGNPNGANSGDGYYNAPNQPGNQPGAGSNPDGYGALPGNWNPNPGGQPVEHPLDPLDPDYYLVDNNQPALPAGTAVNANPLTIGSFNIRTFGQAKIGRMDAMQPIVDIARQFDILAIQELRSVKQDVIPRFIEMINADGSNYAAVVGRRQGYTDRTSANRYFEQYVYVYDKHTVELAGDAYVADAPAHVIHRSPFVQRFRARGPAPAQAFSFVLMNIHIDPDDVPTELGAMAQIIHNVRRDHPGEDDFILLGDLNAAPRVFQSYRWFGNQHAAIDDRWPTNTAGTRNIDNMVFDPTFTNEYLNQSGVLNLLSEFRLNVDGASIISDHMPVWGVFSAYEQPGMMTVEDPRVVR